MSIALDGVDVWLSPLSALGDASRAQASTWLDATEHARWQRFVSASAADQYLLSRMLLRALFARYTGTPAAAWAFEADAHGRPQVVRTPRQPCDLCFSLSHTAGWVAVALAAQPNIGIDIENLQRDASIQGLAGMVFAPAEARAVEGLGDVALRDAFFEVWTLKEAYVKARGLGFRIPLKSFWFDLGASPPAFAGDASHDAAADWQFLSCRLAPDHRLALAIGTPRPQRVRLFVGTPPDELAFAPRAEYALAGVAASGPSVVRVAGIAAPGRPGMA
jgi:4'-phosphopantetheinyl transferase